MNIKSFVDRYEKPIRVKCLKTYFKNSKLKIGKTYDAVGQLDNGVAYLVDVDGNEELHDKAKFEVVNNNE